MRFCGNFTVMLAFVECTASQTLELHHCVTWCCKLLFTRLVLVASALPMSLPHSFLNIARVINIVTVNPFFYSCVVL